MPIYEYECVKCGKTSIRERSMGDRKKVAVCDYCKGRKTFLIVSRCIFSLQGVDWGSTSYGLKSGAPSKKRKK